ncbi:GGDEF domain-containing protein [Candidatus Symbiobacter mobilis]|uniref:diguanylate cyclase n=1 Tax=Candidatus Symbiobacter mobilis CR TaxID=946483 RepID=U5NCA6_9BURK|nr:GGDEF domain-containing protein [Candidatus Symbiobacter mobilis]AGX87838.1 GGDEF domain protein [Candidatus Symbiobacter mobilis CR]
MHTLIEHVVKLTDHRDRDFLELTLSKSLLDLLPIGRIVIAKIVREEGEERWLEVARLDSKGGGRVLADPMRTDFQTLPKLDEDSDRCGCVRNRQRVEKIWVAPDGPRVNYVPLFSDVRGEDEGVIELHSDTALDAQSLQLLDQLCRIYRNMYSLLEFSDRDAMTGLLNRKSLNDAFYNTFFEEVGGTPTPAPAGSEPERRNRVPANYWLGSASIDNFKLISEKHGQTVVTEVLSLVARALKNTFRTYDRLYRFDGGHFGVLMHCPDEALVLAAFERLRMNVEKSTLSQVGRITLSCGFSSVLAEDSPNSLLQKTEVAMNFAQRSGGNKACSYQGLVQRGILVDRPV